jgi:hypothetical protein
VDKERKWKGTGGAGVAYFASGLGPRASGLGADADMRVARSMAGTNILPSAKEKVPEGYLTVFRRYMGFTCVGHAVDLLCSS